MTNVSPRPSFSPRRPCSKRASRRLRVRCTPPLRHYQVLRPWPIKAHRLRQNELNWLTGRRPRRSAERVRHNPKFVLGTRSESKRSIGKEMGQIPDKRKQPRGGERLSMWCLRQALPTLVAGLLMLLLATIANVSATLLFQPLFDRGVLGRQGSILIPIVAMQMSLLLARGILGGAAFDLLARASARLGQDLTLRIFDHLQRHCLSYFLGRPQSELLQLLRNDVIILEQSLGELAGLAITATLQTIVILLVIIAWEPRVALICVVGIGASASLIWLASRLTNRALAREIEANEFDRRARAHDAGTAGLVSQRQFVSRLGAGAAAPAAAALSRCADLSPRAAELDFGGGRGSWHNHLLLVLPRGSVCRNRRQREHGIARRDGRHDRLSDGGHESDSADLCWARQRLAAS